MKPLIATFFGVGLIPFAPGTIASLVAVIIAIAACHFLGASALFVLTIMALGLGFWVTNASHTNPVEDAPEIVIDEVAGQWIAALPIPLFLSQTPSSFWPHWAWLVALVLFRIFDIWKPGLIGRIDRHPASMNGSIMLDDVLAGLCAAVILLGLWFALNFFLN